MIEQYPCKKKLEAGHSLGLKGLDVRLKWSEFMALL